MRTTFTAIALALAASGTPAFAQTAPAAATDADRPATTPSGATFTVPKAWTLRAAPKYAELGVPEGDVKVALIDVGAAADATAAVATAWSAWLPGAPVRTPKLVTPRPARSGWDERQVVDYEIPPNEKRVIQAIAYRAKQAWTVMILDGAEATVEKRGAAGLLVSQSLRPAGYSRESFAGRTAHPMDAARIAQLKSFLETGMKQLGVPGASFALTDRKGTIFSTGIGVRELGKPTPVDADTEFMIASNTKGMATLLLAKLVDEGKLAWNQPVVQLYPTFRLGSPETTAKVEVKHLVCACTGLPRKDMEWLFNTVPTTPAANTFVQLAATQPTSGFGEVFQYNNLMASAAGYLGGHIAYPGVELGKAFDRAMQEKVFAPLGMTATTFDFTRAMKSNWAAPHGNDITGAEVSLGAGAMRLNASVIPYRPAGGAWSSANDLIKYVRFELNEGKLDDGRQWVSAKNLLQRRVANVPSGEDRVYGMGLFVERDLGVEIVHHGGSMFGYKSDIIMIPSAGIGAVLLTNSEDGQMLLRPFLRRLLEILYDGKPEAAADVAAAAARTQAEIAKERELVTMPPDPAAVAALAPAYASAELGTLDVVRKDGGVTFRFVTGTSDMGTKKNADGTTSFVATDANFLFFPMVAGMEGDKRALILRDSQHEYKFVEVK